MIIMSLSIIHFSDIHISNIGDKIISRVDKIKCACASALPSDGDVVIAVSGDIANAGKVQEYELAKSMFDNIASYIQDQKSSHVHFVFVPGNHDCDFSEEKSIRTTLVESAHTGHIDEEYFLQVAEVQDNYCKFAASCDIDPIGVLPKKEIILGTDKILFLLGNTAWMSVLHENPGKIIMPHHQFSKVNPSEYKVVFYMYHHPDNWLNPDYKNGFVSHVRNNADIILVGHEHERDSYEKSGESFSVFCNHGKELQDRSSDDSAFTVLNFDTSFQNFDVIDYSWDGSKYDRISTQSRQYHKNRASAQNVYTPNVEVLEYADDMGMTINHFSKEEVRLSDIYVWPELSKCDYHSESHVTTKIRSNIESELSGNVLNIIIGSSSSGKSALAKTLFVSESRKDTCCILLSGRDFSSSDEAKIRDAIEKGFVNQYYVESLEDFNQLPKENRCVIIDDFDLITLAQKRRSTVLDYLCGFFGKVTIFLSSYLEIPTFITAQSLSSLTQLIYYDILPLGNRKRKEMICKWYSLGKESLTEVEFDKRVESARQQIDTFLGNGAAIMPAWPAVVIGALQNGDAISKSYNGSKYGFLYESAINSCLSKIATDYSVPGRHDIDVGILSELAFDMLLKKQAYFSKEQLEVIIKKISDIYFLSISPWDFLKRMEEARIIYHDTSSGEVYKFKYPYIFYYFSGHYIAYHLKDKIVRQKISEMSSHLYNETYGNIIIFVCHFADSKEVIDDILLNAYCTLENYDAFDFSKANPIFENIKEAVDALVPKTISGNEEVDENKNRALTKMDEAEINDGHVDKGEETINIEVSEKEKDMAAVTSAFKTLEVLGQVLQNYPMAVVGNEKVDIIGEMHKLGMRAVEAIIKTMGYLEEELVDFIIIKATQEKKVVRRDQVVQATRKFIAVLISVMSRGMVHQVAVSLNSDHLLKAAQITFEKDTSISSKLIYIDLKLNCLNKVDYNEIRELKKAFDDSKERFASRILDSIVGHYLNYNQCDHSLRSKLCALFQFPEKNTLIATQKNLLT